jgi:predicted small lipoprotein YifL
VKPSLWGSCALFLLLVGIGLLAACGKKGPPLPPLSRVPAPPANPQAARVGDDVYLWFVVPSANVSGQSPADVSAVELYAVTSVIPPGGPDLTEAAVRIGSYPVHVPVPAPVTGPDGVSLPAVPAPPGFAQGATAVVRETLTPELRAATVLPARPGPSPLPVADDSEPLAGPIVGPAAGGLRRHYFFVSVAPRGRTSAPTAVLSVPVDDASEPPTGLRLEYGESGMTLTWEPSPNARAAPAPPADPTLLPARPLLPPPSPTGYHVSEAPATAAGPPDPYALGLPTTLTTQPLGTTTFAIPGAVRFGEERCFVVRAVDAVNGTITVGRASPPACVTPVDTFPPAAPRQLAAIAGVGVINLIWEPNSEADLAGYIVLRGTAPGGTLQALTPNPIRETTYRDQTATPGVLYVYAVVAVDNASPQNVSAQSNRVEDSSRTP